MATEESMANSEMATLVLGAYQWKVPVETLVSHSSFFKAALTSGFKESQTRTVKIYDHDPFIVGKAVAFMLYGDPGGEGTYYTSFRMEDKECALANVMRPHSGLAVFGRNYYKFRNSPPHKIKCLLVLFADMYDMDKLLVAAVHDLFTFMYRVHSPSGFQDLYWECHNHLSEEVIDRHEILRACFVYWHLGNLRRFNIADPRLLQWFQAYPNFVIDMYDGGESMKVE